MKWIVNALGKLNWGERAPVALLLFVTTVMASSAQTLTTLAVFNGTNGAEPEAPLVQGFNGKLYGVTTVGGTYNQGAVFNITTAGKLTTLYNFCSQVNCADGSFPVWLIQATNGDFYGATTEGGSGNPDGPCGSSCGTLFKITPAGKLTTIYSFCAEANCPDGSRPTGLIQATNGDFYGIASSGANNAGIVFKFASGALTTLYNFCSQTNCADGAGPVGSLVQGTDGNFYGTTVGGGTDDQGTVFRITPGGSLTTLCSVDGYPYAGLVQATNGNFYGTTQSGEIFKCTPGGTLTYMANVGGYPYAGLIQATDGNFYGTTFAGGTNSICQYGCGTIYKMTPPPHVAVTTLYNFCSQTNCTDGYAPYAGLVQDTNGSLYGVTVAGGATLSNSYGTVFSLGVGLGPFVETRPTSGKVGATIQILGTNLAGATSVTFNGTPASPFTVNPTNSAITTTVPTGATTGKVQVILPGGVTLSSNVPFRVRP